jgi:thiaminase/transcriptional activator TenA
VRFSDELRAAAEPLWAAQLEHPFVRGIGDGTLDPERFRHYVRQDYVFLIDYGRLLALACARAPHLEQMTRLAEVARETLVTEMDLHRAFALEWGIAPSELEAERPAPTTRAYCDFLLRTATLGDFAELVAVLLPCMWGYSELGRGLAALPASGHALYERWIATYADDGFAQLAGWCRDLCDDAAGDVGAAGRARMRTAFVESSRHELAFWEMAWRLEAST